MSLAKLMMTEIFYRLDLPTFKTIDIPETNLTAELGSPQTLRHSRTVSDLYLLVFRPAPSSVDNLTPRSGVERGEV